MTQRELIAYIARRLPHQSRRDVAELLDLLCSLWAEQLRAGESITIPSVGRLSITTQKLVPGGIVQHEVTRLYGRFHPTSTIREAYIRKERK